jgi:hypothetical protein
MCFGNSDTPLVLVERIAYFLEYKYVLRDCPALERNQRMRYKRFKTVDQLSQHHRLYFVSSYTLFLNIVISACKETSSVCGLFYKFKVSPDLPRPGDVQN